MSDAPVAKRTFAVEHRTMRCNRSFSAVHETLVSAIPRLDPNLMEMLARAATEEIALARKDGPKLWLFLVRDHGALVAADGKSSRAIQYEIGNPLTAERMTRRQLAAGLYAPLRVILYEDDAGRAVFEYDLPSTLFGQFGDPEVSAVGIELDGEVEAALSSAAGGQTPVAG